MTAIATLILAIVGIVGVVLALRSLKAVERQARAAEIAAGVAASNAKTTEGTLLVAQSAERAYIAMSHTSHKLKFHEPGAIWFEIEVRNHGRTPGTVLGGSINILIGPDGHKTPATLTPSGTRVAVDPAFLVPNKHMRIKSMIFNLDQTQIKQATEPLDLEGPEPLDLWLAGYVDYRDGFENYHRGGYGRHWDRDTQDLVFDQTTAALNYDQELTPEERKQYES